MHISISQQINITILLLYACAFCVNTIILLKCPVLQRFSNRQPIDIIYGRFTVTSLKLQRFVSLLSCKLTIHQFVGNDLLSDFLNNLELHYVIYLLNVCFLYYNEYFDAFIVRAQ